MSLDDWQLSLPKAGFRRPGQRVNSPHSRHGDGCLILGQGLGLKLLINEPPCKILEGFLPRCSSMEHEMHGVSVLGVDTEEPLTRLDQILCTRI